MTDVRMLLVMVIGAFTGLLGGLFGKGGSAIATPLLHLVGVPAFAAVASPLPATIPSTLVAAWAYARAGAIDRHILRTTLVWGIPATVVGAVATHWLGGAALILLTDAVVLVLGTRILHHRIPAAGPTVGGDRLHTATTVLATRDPAPPAIAGVAAPSGPFSRGGVDLAAPSSRAGALVLEAGDPGVAEGSSPAAMVAVVVGLASGLLGNSGGFLLAPLFVTVLHVPLKKALGTSLAAAAGLAIPGTIVHAAMGHIDWNVTLLFGLASIPLSAAGARLALRTASSRLEVAYGVALVVLGAGLLALQLA
jgi:uncharacterized membrane protein YfcA